MECPNKSLLEAPKVPPVKRITPRDHQASTCPERARVSTIAFGRYLTRLFPALSLFGYLDEFIAPIWNDLAQYQDVRTQQMDLDLIWHRQNVIDVTH